MYIIYLDAYWYYKHRYKSEMKKRHPWGYVIFREKKRIYFKKFHFQNLLNIFSWKYFFVYVWPVIYHWQIKLMDSSHIHTAKLSDIGVAGLRLRWGMRVRRIVGWISAKKRTETMEKTILFTWKIQWFN